MKADAETIQLIEACKARKRKAYKELYDRYAPMLYPICLRYTHSREDANDILHDTFIKIFDKIQTIQYHDNLLAWMRRIAINTALDFIRNYVSTPLTIEDEPDPTAKTETPTYNHHDVQIIMQAISQLPDLRRVIFNMREIEGYDFADIAQQLNIPEGSVRVNLTRAKQQLRDILTEIDPHIDK